MLSHVTEKDCFILNEDALSDEHHITPGKLLLGDRQTTQTLAAGLIAQVEAPGTWSLGLMVAKSDSVAEKSS